MEIQKSYEIFTLSNKQKQINMKSIKIKKLAKLVQAGIVECITDLKIGYVEIRVLQTGCRGTVRVK